MTKVYCVVRGGDWVIACFTTRKQAEKYIHKHYGLKTLLDDEIKIVVQNV